MGFLYRRFCHRDGGILHAQTYPAPYHLDTPKQALASTSQHCCHRRHLRCTNSPQSRGAEPRYLTNQQTDKLDNSTPCGKGCPVSQNTFRAIILTCHTTSSHGSEAKPHDNKTQQPPWYNFSHRHKSRTSLSLSLLFSSNKPNINSSLQYPSSRTWVHNPPQTPKLERCTRTRYHRPMVCPTQRRDMDGTTAREIRSTGTGKAVCNRNRNRNRNPTACVVPRFQNRHGACQLEGQTISSGPGSSILYPCLRFDTSPPPPPFAALPWLSCSLPARARTSPRKVQTQVML